MPGERAVSEGASARRPGITAALQHRDFRLLSAAFLTSSIGTWAYNVALAVWLIDTTGRPGWVAAATVGRFLPALVLSPYGGVLAERFERVRLMRTVDVVLFLVMAALAAEMALGVHPALVVLTAAVASSLSTVYEPAAAAMTPQLVPERDLGAANAVRNTVDNVCVVAGPAIGALLLVLADPPGAVLFNALTFLASALLLSRMQARSVPVDVSEGGQLGASGRLLVGIKTVATSSTTAVLVGYSVLATFVFGTDTVLFVVVSEEVLGTGAEGYGYLLAGLGVGGVLAAGLVPRIERLPRLGTVILLGMAGYCLPTLLLLVVDDPVVAFAVQCLRGASTLVVDVLALTALQRSVAPDRLARVFGAINGLMLLAALAGSLAVPLALSVVGLDGVLWAVGLGIPLLSLAGLPWLRRMDQQAAARRATLATQLALLARCDLFDSVREGALEQLAASAEYVEVPAGAVVLRQGEPADALYVIDAGVFSASAVRADGEHVTLQDMGEGSWFAEIGLLEAIPRTATVVTATGGRLLRVEGPAFLTALTQGAPSAALVDAAALRLSRTDPTRSLTRAGLAQAG